MRKHEISIFQCFNLITMIISSCIHVFTNDNLIFSLWLLKIPFSLFIPLLTDSWYHNLDIVNSTKETLTCKKLRCIDSKSFKYRRNITVSYGVSLLYVLNTLHPNFLTGWTNLHSHYHVQGFSFPSSSAVFIIICFLQIGHLY